MPPTPMPVQTIAGPFYPSLPIGAGNLQSSEFQAADIVNGNSAPITPDGRLLVLVRNMGVVDHQITIDSSADSLGREADITAYVVPPSSGTTICILGPFKRLGWEQDDVDHLLKITANHADISLLAVVLPAIR